MYIKKISICTLLLFIIILHTFGNGNKDKEINEEPYTQEESGETGMKEYKDITQEQAWVEILGMGVEISTLATLRDKVTVERGWEYVHGIGWNAVPDQKGLMLHFYNKNDVPLVSFMLLPYQDLNRPHDPASGEIIHPDSFYTVTEHAIVFGPLFRKNSAPENDLNDAIEKMLSYTMFKEHFNKKQSEKAEAPIPQSLQVISLALYPNYMVMDVALPGSIVPENKELLALSGNRMIKLSLVPDKGPVTQHWIAPHTSGEVSQENINLKNIIHEELSTFLNVIKNESIDPSHEEVRLEVFNNIMQDSEKILTSDDKKSMYVKLILRLLALEQSYGYSHGLDYGEMFPDYEPKTTPDTILDYRPSLLEYVKDIPEGSLKNLNSLISFHDDYVKKAKNNPGHWEQGNIILGGPEKEYIPSDEELILCEIDSRIKGIMKGTGTKMLDKYCMENSLSGMEIELKSIEIWHADVMGSGRFFYASELFTEIFRLEWD